MSTNIPHQYTTVNWQKFTVIKFSWMAKTVKIKCTKVFNRINYTLSTYTLWILCSGHVRSIKQTLALLTKLVNGTTPHEESGAERLRITQMTGSVFQQQRLVMACQHYKSLVNSHSQVFLLQELKCNHRHDAMMLCVSIQFIFMGKAFNEYF